MALPPPPPALCTPGYVAFQANTNTLDTYEPANNHSFSSSLGTKPGTCLSIMSHIFLSGSVPLLTAFQAKNPDLSIYYPSTGSSLDTSQPMAAKTSPSVSGTGPVACAFSGGVLNVHDPVTKRNVTSIGISPMDAGTSPFIGLNSGVNERRRRGFFPTSSMIGHPSGDEPGDEPLMLDVRQSGSSSDHRPLPLRIHNVAADMGHSPGDRFPGEGTAGLQFRYRPAGPAADQAA